MTIRSETDPLWEQLMANPAENKCKLLLTTSEMYEQKSFLFVIC